MDQTVSGTPDGASNDPALKIKNSYLSRVLIIKILFLKFLVILLYKFLSKFFGLSYIDWR